MTHSQLFKKQYIAHARYRCQYPDNSLLLYQYVLDNYDYKIIETDVVFTFDGIPVLNHSTEVLLYKNGVKETIDISKTTYDELKVFSLSDTSFIGITALEELLLFVKDRGLYVMLDLTFQDYKLSHYKTLYNLVSGFGLKDNVIWGDPNILKLALFDTTLTCQFGGSWGRKLLLSTFFKSFFCGNTIMSFSYYGGRVEDFSNIVKWGHYLGFIMKVATINDEDIASRFWALGTDLINTDVLKNKG